MILWIERLYSDYFYFIIIRYWNYSNVNVCLMCLFKSFVIYFFKLSFELANLFILSLYPDINSNEYLQFKYYEECLI